MAGEIPAWETLTAKQRGAFALGCIGSLELFIRCMFAWVRSERFLVNWHHRYICRILEECEQGQHKRLVLNCPPGSTKTELVSVHFPAWIALRHACQEKPSKSRWLPISYSADLVDENGARVRDLIRSEPFRAMTRYSGIETAAKSDWTAKAPNGSEIRLYGTSLLGQAVGRRAGYMTDGGFTGALVFDDPLPPKDEFSPRNLTRSNTALAALTQTRLAQGDDTPVMMFQQRICPGDSTEHLMSQRHPDQWERITIPALVDGKYLGTLPDDIREQAIADTGYSGEPVSYWPSKETTEKLRTMQAADAYFFASQYMQEPDDALLAGVIYKRELAAMESSGRLTTIPIEPDLPCVSAWDLGMNDLMTIWIAQLRGAEVRLVHCIWDNDLSGDVYIQRLQDWAEANQVRFTAHYGPHDLAVRELFAGGKTRQQSAAEMGLKFTPTARPPVKKAGIAAVRRLFPRLWADPDALGKAWRGIERYHREFDPARDVFTDNPSHDWASHFADGLQTLALGLPAVGLKRDTTRPHAGISMRDLSGYSGPSSDMTSWAG